MQIAAAAATTTTYVCYINLSTKTLSRNRTQFTTKPSLINKSKCINQQNKILFIKVARADNKLHTFSEFW